MILKNRITRQESRSPSPKTVGPSVPAENLSDVSVTSEYKSESSRVTNESMLKFIENQTKNILLYCESVLRSGGTGRIPEMAGSALSNWPETIALTSGLNAVSHHHACPSFCNLGTFYLVNRLLITVLGLFWLMIQS